MKNTESEEHLPPYHFLYFLFLRLSFLSNQTQLLQKKKKIGYNFYKHKQDCRDLWLNWSPQIQSLHLVSPSRKTPPSRFDDKWRRWCPLKEIKEEERPQGQVVELVFGTIWKVKLCLEESKILRGKWRRWK